MFHDPKLSKEETTARLKLNDEQTKRKDQIRAVASHLKSQILGMPKSLNSTTSKYGKSKDADYGHAAHARIFDYLTL